MAIWALGISGAIEMVMKGAAQKIGQSPNLTGDRVDLAGLAKPAFIITIDTEEEFDWRAPFSRDRHGVTHVSSMPRFQALCERYGVQPVYLIDYPIAEDGLAAEMLGGWVRGGTAEVGLQLHPWVTPPHLEEINVHNSYACNLPPELEREKLLKLAEITDRQIGAKPVAFRAGRYGAGQNSFRVLQELGIKIDTSVRPYFDYSRHGGPNYAKGQLFPYWLAWSRLIELPVTSVFSGLLKGNGATLFDTAFRSETMRATLARSGMLERIALTPEGIPAEKAIEAIDIALKLALPLLVFSFHSPSLAVGHTPYVRSEADLEDFYIWWERVLGHLQLRGVAPSSMAEIQRAAFAK
jgi:hypothetical protein